MNSYVMWGMSLQAFATSFCVWKGLVQVTPTQQLIAGLIFLVLSIVSRCGEKA